MLTTGKACDMGRDEVKTLYIISRKMILDLPVQGDIRGVRDRPHGVEPQLQVRGPRS